LGDDRRRSVGLCILGTLAGSRLATDDHLQLLDASSDPDVVPLEAFACQGGGGGAEEEPSDVHQEGL